MKFGKSIILSAVILAGTQLGGCALYNSILTKQPLTAAEVQADLVNAQAALKVAGCDVAAASAVAAPIVAVAADAQGNKVLQVVDTTGAIVCSTPAPATIVSPVGTTLTPAVMAPVPASVPASTSMIDLGKRDA